jgi:LysM repeat protein
MAAPAPAAGGGGRGGVLTEKLGPLATWIWLLIATVGIVIYYLIAKYRQGKSGTSSTPQATTGQAQPGQVAGVQDVPDIILQNYTTQNGSTINVPAPAGATPPPPPPPTTTQPVPNKPVTPPKTPTPQPPILNAKYTVKVGDTLDSVAAKFGIARVTLAHGNGLGTGAGLRTGQVLNVPSPAPGGKPNPAK